ncbi:MAG: VOC family protein [Armatimonadetes bacterium]|nr:VOC family protein [Armatimonadota bacterium]
MDHVTLVVEDLQGAISFFTALGMMLQGQASVGGEWVDRLCGMKGIQADIAMMRTSDGTCGIELTMYRSPDIVRLEPSTTSPNSLGLRQIMFEVEDIEETVSMVESHGGSLLGEIVQYQDFYRLCYTRGPAGTIIAFAQKIAPLDS